MTPSFLSLRHICKKYGTYAASDDISFDIPKGKIFGLLGPNGAGKTTLIRMITRIIFPDSGEILFNQNQLSEADTSRIGYMPEERGLYKKMKVGEQLIYLARLKGKSKEEAKKNVQYWLNRLEITSWENKTIDELSKGMSQKIQFIGTVLHDPELLILDEPFSGLDPINSKLIEEEINQLRLQGKTIIFSTHRMEQVEEICDEIVLVNKGKKILEGNVHDLKQQFKENKYRIVFDGGLPDDFATHFDLVAQTEGSAIVKVSDVLKPNALLNYFIEKQRIIHEYKELLPTLNEIFIRNVNQ